MEDNCYRLLTQEKPNAALRRTYQVLLVALVLSLVVVPPAGAQTDRGTIIGLVTDASGAVVPDATIDVIQLQTNATLQFATNSEGLYTAPNLAMGTYRMVVTRDGFNTVTREPVEIRPSVQVRVDFILTPGAVAESIEVTAEAPMLDVSATSHTAGLNEELIDELPLVVSAYQRSITDLLQNLPGYTGGGAFTPRANGGSTGDTEVFIDGGPASEWGIARGGLSEVSPQIEQVGEFSVVANGFNAEYGGFGNWFTNVTIKSGTNQLHGSIYNHLGNSALNAKDWFQPGVTPFRQNEGGVTLGGPIIKDRTFFFGSLGLFYIRQGAGGGLTTVPTEKQINGDFSEFGSTLIYDPLTSRIGDDGAIVRDPFAGNKIPEARITDAAKEIAQYLPSPDLPGINNNFVSRTAPSWPYMNAYSPLIKIDHTISMKQRLSVMYQKQIKHRIIWEHGFAPIPQWGEDQTNPLDHVTDQIANNWKWRINHDYILSPSVINHVTVSFDRYVNRGANKTAGQGWDDQLGILGIPADDGSFPAISFSGGVSAPEGLGRSYDEDWRETRYSVNESLTVLKGRHTLKFGFEINYNNENRRFGGQAGSFTFSNSSTAHPGDSGAGSAFASFLLGAVNNGSAYIGLRTRLRFRKYALFAQDEWRATRKFTVSYGLRWDYMPPMYEVDDYMTSFQPNLTNPEAGGLLGALGYAGDGEGRIGGQFQDSWRKGFGPRLGLAYQLNENTMIRASGGIVYANSGNQVPFSTTGALGYSGTPTFNSADGYTPVFYWGEESFPQDFKKPPLVDPSFLNGQAISYIRRDANRLPQIVNWSFVLQRYLGGNWAVEAAYIGNRSTHLTVGSGASLINYVSKDDLGLGFLLLQPIDSAAAQGAGFEEPFSGFANQTGANTVAQALKPYPQYTSISSDVALQPMGKASFHSLQLKATKRFSSGLSGLFFFTWMKSITNSAGGNTTYANFAEGSLQYPGENPTAIDPGVPAATFGANFSYDLPFGEGKRFLTSASGVTQAVLGGWTLSGFLRYQSGSALQIWAINPFASTLGYSSLAPTVYANYNGGSVYKNTDLGNFDPYTDQYLNPASFESPALFTFGNTARYLSWARGPALMSESLSILKNLPITERFNLELGADFINPFNLVRWGSPSTLAGTPTFGMITDTQGSRSIQINMKLMF